MGSWLTGWSHRKTVTITGETGAGTDYQVNLSIGDASGGDFHLEGNCTSFPNDIQVTDNDQTTPLDYWVEDLTVDPITMWVKVADDLGVNVDISIYYDKLGESSASGISTTFIFGDDGEAYSDGDDLTVGGWTIPIHLGSYLHEYDNTEAYTGGISLHIRSNMEVSVQHTHTLTDSHVFEWDAFEGVSYVMINSQKDPGNYQGFWFIGWYDTQSTTRYVTYTESAYQLLNDLVRSAGWHHFKKVVKSDGSVEFWVDDVKDTYEAPTSSQTQSNTIALRAGGSTNGRTWIDRLRVRKYTSPEPAFYSAGAEETTGVDISVTDSGVGITEIISLLSNIPVVDLGVGSEIISLLESISITDSGIGTEIISLLANIPVTDSGIGSEIISLLSNIPVVDSGVGSEIVSLLSNIPVADSGVGSETISLLSNIPIIDSGAVTEIISLLSGIPITDAGVLSDFLSVTKLIPGALPPKVTADKIRIIPSEPVTIFAQVHKHYLHHHDPTRPTTVSLSIFKSDGVAVIKNQPMFLRSPLEGIFSYTMTSPVIPAPYLMSFHSQNPEAFAIATLLVKEPRKLPERNSMFLTREENTLCEVKSRKKTIISIDLVNVAEETYMSFILYKRDTILSDYTFLREITIHTPYPTSTKEIEIEPEYYEVKVRGKIIEGESVEIPFWITE